jgi:ribonucleoside-triphosphate reductase (formate)
VTRISQIRKRDGRVVPFDGRRVADAIYRAARSVGGEDRFLAEELAGVVALYLERSHLGRIPAVSDVEDAVERVLEDTGHSKTAKAFVVHRDRRRAARDRVVVEDDEHGNKPLPLVGGESGGPVRAWSKTRIVDALVEEAGLDEQTADDVARAVEERIVSSGLPRVGTSLVRSLVDAELLDRGHVHSRDRQRVVGLPKSDLARRLEEGPSDRRATDPAAVAESIGEEVLRQHVLEEDVPREAAEAHRLADLHLSDLGSPLAARHVTLSLEALLSAHLRGESASRANGARRFASAIAEAVTLHGAAASRTFTLEDVNVYWAPFVDRLEEDALFVEARELLLSPAVRAFPRRGGLLRLELVLCTEVPARLSARSAPPPAPPGTTWGDFDDAALRSARALLLAAADLRREGAGAGLPDMTVVLPRATRRDAATRALLRDAITLAADGGEPTFVFDAAGLPARGGRALRAAASDLVDPLRHERGDISVATHAAINLVAPARRIGPRRIDEYLDEIGRMAGLAVAAAAARRRRMTRGGESPDGSLWGVRRGIEPLLDPDGALHVIEPVGADRAVIVLGDPRERPGQDSLHDRILARLRSRVLEEARRNEIEAVVAEIGDPEAARRFAETDAERFEVVRGWFADGSPTYRPSARRSDASADAAFFEPAGVASPRSISSRVRLRVRIDADRRPGPDTLLAALEASARDDRIAEHVLDPWPRRHVRTS